jgi:heme-degrading monooxygenase HmoA
MFASIRRYRLTQGPIEELARRVDEGFAEEISARPGFVSYEFIECGADEIMTISMFSEPQQAEDSRELAQRWTEDNLRGLEFHRIEALRGEVMVSRAAGEMLEPAHVQVMGKFASIRRYALRSGDVGELMHTVDQVFADQLSGMAGFEAYHALDCGRGEILSISLFRDQSTAEASDDQALQFVSKHLGTFDIERTEVIGGEVRVSRALAEVLEPTHA